MEVSLIACIKNGNYIGKDNDLLYRINADLVRFKKLTERGIIIMGWGTFTSLGFKPLGWRINIVISNNPKDYEQPQTERNLVVVGSLQAALDYVKQFPVQPKEVFVIGGETVFKEALAIASKLYMTHVDDDTIGDRKFPEILETEWKVSDEVIYRQSKYKFKFTDYERR